MTQKAYFIHPILLWIIEGFIFMFKEKERKEKDGEKREASVYMYIYLYQSYVCSMHLGY